MRLRERFKRLSFWNKVGTIGAVASIVAIPLALVLYCLPMFEDARPDADHFRPVFARGTEVTLLGPEWRNSLDDIEIDAEGLKISVTEVPPGKRLIKMCISRKDKQLRWVGHQSHSKEWEFENDFIAVTVVEVDPTVMLSNPPQGRFRIKVTKIPKIETGSYK